MAGQQYTTTEEEMVAFSGKISSVNQSIQGEISRLNTVVDTITSGGRVLRPPRTTSCSRR